MSSWERLSYEVLSSDKIAASVRKPDSEDISPEIARCLSGSLRSVQCFEPEIKIHRSEKYMDISGFLGEYQGQPTDEPSTITCYSSDDEDRNDSKSKAGGYGARKVELFGLDANYNEVSSTISMHGKLHVNAGLNWTRCNYARVVQAGNNKSSAGVITIKQDTGGSELFKYVVIPPYENSGGPCAFTVPAGKSAIIHNYQFSFLDRDENVFSVTLDLVARRQKSNAFIVLNRTVGMRGQSFTEVPFSDIIVPEKTDVKVRASDVIGTVGASVRINYTLLNNSSVDINKVRYSV